MPLIPWGSLARGRPGAQGYPERYFAEATSPGKSLKDFIQIKPNSGKLSKQFPKVSQCPQRPGEVASYPVSRKHRGLALPTLAGFPGTLPVSPESLQRPSWAPRRAGWGQNPPPRQSHEPDGLATSRRPQPGHFSPQHTSLPCADTFRNPCWQACFQAENLDMSRISGIPGGFIAQQLGRVWVADPDPAPALTRPPALALVSLLWPHSHI